MEGSRPHQKGKHKPAWYVEAQLEEKGEKEVKNQVGKDKAQGNGLVTLA